MASGGDLDDLEAWLCDGYERSFRTARLILGDRSDAEGAVQEAYLRAWRFRASLANGADVRTWLDRVVANTCNAKLREEASHRHHRPADLDDALSTDSGEAEQLMLEDHWLTALRSLPPHLRTVVVLRYFGDLSDREMATAVGKRPGTVRSRLHEARRLLAAHPALQSEGATGNPGANP